METSVGLLGKETRATRHLISNHRRTVHITATFHHTTVNTLHITEKIVIKLVGTVICLAKHQDYSGIHIVGWYENATLLGKWLKAPEDRLYLSVTGTNPSYEWLYCITSKTAYFVPPEHRTSSFSHPSIGQGKYSFLAGPKVKQTKNKAHVLKILQNKLTKLNSIAVKNPTAASAPDLEADPVDPLHGFGTPEHRKKVEKAAEIAVIKYYAAKGFTHKDVTKRNLGYDFIFAKGKDEHHVEVKGTAGNVSRFFMTRNEDAYRENRTWRFAIVTNALTSEPIVQVLNNREFNAEFELVPFVYRGVRKIKPVKI